MADGMNLMPSSVRKPVLHLRDGFCSRDGLHEVAAKSYAANYYCMNY